MAEERIDIVITERGSRVVKRNLEDIGGTAAKSANSVDFLKKALGTLGAAFGLQQIVRLTSAWSDLTSRVNIAAGSVENAAAVMDRLQSIARRTYAELGSTAEIYLSNSSALKELGYSTQQQLDFTEAMTNALVISGAKQERAATVINALSKAMMAGKLSGENWNTVLQQGGRIVDALAEGTGKSISELRQMAAAGTLTSDTVFTALTGQLEKLQQEADSMPATITDALVVLRNRFMEVIGTFDQAGGFTDVIVRGLDLLSEHLETIIKLTAGVAAGFVLIGGASKAIDIARGAVIALNAAIAANPIGFLLTVLTSVIATLTIFRDEIKLGTDELTTLGDLMRAFGETVGAVFSAIWEWAQNTFGPLVDLIKDWVGEVDLSLVGILRFVAKAVDSYYGAWYGAILAVIELFKGLPSALGDLMTRALNVLLGKITDFVNAAGRILSTITEFVGLGQINAVDLTLSNQHEGAARKLGENVGSAFMTGFNSTAFASDFLEGRIKRAQEIAAERAGAATAQADLNVRGPAATLVDPNAEKEAKKLKDALDALIGSYDKVWAAQQEYAEGEKLLNRAVAAGLITAERRAEVLGLMSAQLRDALDPMGALNRELDEERRLLGMLSDAREIETQLKAIELDLMNQGVILGAEELEQLRERLRLIQEETKAAQARQSVYDAVIGQQRDFTAQLQAINELTASGAITREQANAFLVQQNSDLLAGTIEAQQAQITATEQMYARIDELRQADLISEQTAQQLKARAQAETNAQRLATAQQFFGNLAVLARSENRELAAIGKAAAVTQATIDGVLAVQKALASAPPPANYALAAAVGVAAAANVAQILAANTNGYAFGGNFEVGGTGGTDSQLVAFRATPGEKVSISTPQQERDRARQEERTGGGGEAGATNVINVLDPALLQDYLTTPEGERVLVNVIRRNRNSIGLR